jgi:hypothetical protein
MRLIDADGLLGILNDSAKGGAESIKISEIIYFLKCMPTRGGIPFDTPTGAVKVVRCKDCRRERYCEFTQYQGMNGYCSLAESKDGD